MPTETIILYCEFKFEPYTKHISVYAIDMFYSGLTATIKHLSSYLNMYNV